MMPSLVSATVLTSQAPISGGGVARSSQLWQDPGPDGNDLDGDAICWEDFTLGTTAAIDHLEWWGTGASELGFQIEIWRQDPGSIAYQPLAIFDQGPGHSLVTPEARFSVTYSDLTLSSGPGGLTHFVLELASPVTLAANDSGNPRWFIGIVGLTAQPFVTWNWSQGTGGSTKTYQWIRGGIDGGGDSFRPLPDGRALVLAGVVPEPSAAARLGLGVLALAFRRRIRNAPFTTSAGA